MVSSEEPHLKAVLIQRKPQTPEVRALQHSSPWESFSGLIAFVVWVLWSSRGVSSDVLLLPQTLNRWQRYGPCTVTVPGLTCSILQRNSPYSDERKTWAIPSVQDETLSYLFRIPAESETHHVTTNSHGRENLLSSGFLYVNMSRPKSRGWIH